MSQSSKQKDINRRGAIDREETDNRRAPMTEHTSRADQRAPWSGPSELTAQRCATEQADRRGGAGIKHKDGGEKKADTITIGWSRLTG